MIPAASNILSGVNQKIVLNRYYDTALAVSSGTEVFANKLG